MVVPLFIEGDPPNSSKNIIKELNRMDGFHRRLDGFPLLCICIMYYAFLRVTVKCRSIHELMRAVRHVHHHVDEHSRRCYYHWKGICSTCMVSCTSICIVKSRHIAHPQYWAIPLLCANLLYRGRVCCTLVFSR